MSKIIMRETTEGIRDERRGKREEKEAGMGTHSSLVVPYG